MIILLDTSTLLWQLGLEKSKLGARTMKLMREADKVYVSAVSIMELHIKTMIGKLDAPSDCEQMILEAGDTILSLSAKAGDSIRKFPALKRHDPFDRMLLAQAEAESLLFVTPDTILLGLGHSFVVDARL